MAPTVKALAAYAGAAANSDRQAQNNSRSQVIREPPRSPSAGLFHAEEIASERRRRGGSAIPTPEDQDEQGQKIRNHVHKKRRDVHAERLELQLQRLCAAEDQGAGKSPERIPFCEYDERDGDEAAAGSHALVPCQSERKRKMGAADRAQRPRDG